MSVISDGAFRDVRRLPSSDPPILGHVSRSASTGAATNLWRIIATLQVEVVPCRAKVR